MTSISQVILVIVITYNAAVYEVLMSEIPEII